MVRRRYLRLMPQAWGQIVAEVGPFVSILCLDGEQETSERLIGWIDKTAERVVHAAARMRNWEGVGLCALQQVVLAGGPASAQSLEERVAKARALLSHIADPQVRQVHETRLTERAADLASPPPEMTIDQEQDFVRHMATTLGIDLSGRADPFGEIARIGIEDMNPERVLRNCRHLLVCADSYGAVGQVLGLPTAGMKWVNCTKHGHGLGNLSLDNAYAVFRQDYCAGCPDAAPHGPGWRWTREWQHEQDQAHSEVLRRCREFGGPEEETQGV